MGLIYEVVGLSDTRSRLDRRKSSTLCVIVQVLIYVVGELNAEFISGRWGENQYRDSLMT